MGLARTLRLVSDPVVQAATAPVLREPRTASPPAFTSLSGMIETDLEGVYFSRQQAMRVPALSNGVTTLAAIAQQLPLTAETTNGSVPTDEVVQFLDTLDPDVARGWTVSQTMQDLIFHGAAYWVVMEEYATDGVTPRYVRWVDYSLTQLDPKTGVLRTPGHTNPRTGEESFAPAHWIRFDGVVDGLLSRGYESIRTALANVRQARRYAENPAPAQTLTDKPDRDSLSETDAAKAVNDLMTATRTGGIAYLGGVVLNQNGWSAREIQLVEARQQDAVEAARLLTVHPRYVAAPSQGSDLTYANLSEVRRDLFEIGGLATFLVPIEQRLSLSNPDRMGARRQVTPSGTRVRFNAELFFNQLAASEPADAPKPLAEVPTP